MDKLSELSKPVGHFRKQPDGSYWPLSKSTATMDMAPLYSQEYVSALEKRIAEFETEEARRKLIRDTWNNIPAWKPLKHSGRGA